MKVSLDDPTADRNWQDEQTDRLLGYEVLSRSMRAEFQPMDAERLSDKIGLDKGVAFRVVQSIQKSLTLNAV